MMTAPASGRVLLTPGRSTGMIGPATATPRMPDLGAPAVAALPASRTAIVKINPVHLMGPLSSSTPGRSHRHRTTDGAFPHFLNFLCGLSDRPAGRGAWLYRLAK